MHQSVFLSRTSDSDAKEGGVGEETEKRMDENQRRDSKAVVGEELELENCFRETVCACAYAL